MIEMRIATYEDMSQERSPLRRWRIAKMPPATNPQRATIAIGTWM